MIKTIFLALTFFVGFFSTAKAADYPYPRTSSQFGIADSMTAGARRTSINGAFRLDFQADRNLVVYRNPDGRAMWSTHTAGSGADTFILCLATNGAQAPQTIESCLYGPNGLVWRSYGLGRFIDPNYTTYLDMQDDGNLVLSHVVPKWSSKTVATSTNTVNVIFQRGSRIYPGATYSTGGGAYRLDFRTDGNLTVSHNGLLKWSAGTAGRNAAYAEMQVDGNFVIYTAKRQALWATGTYKNPGAYLAFQNDGNLAVYYPQPVWDSFGNVHQ